MTNDKPVYSVFETDNLDQFQFFKSNRPVSEAHVEKLVAKIRNRNRLKEQPGLVTGDYKVVDGQHRLAAVRAIRERAKTDPSYAGLNDTKFYYIIGEDLSEEDMSMLNSQNRNWTLEDYLHHWIMMGHEDYKVLKEFKEKYNLSTIIATQLLRGNHNKYSTPLREGFFKVVDLARAEELASRYQDLRPFLRKPGHRSTYIAAFRITRHKNYDHERMLNNLRIVGTLIEPTVTARESMRVLEDIHNYKSRNIVRFF